MRDDDLDREMERVERRDMEWLPDKTYGGRDTAESSLNEVDPNLCTVDESPHPNEAKIWRDS